MGMSHPLVGLSQVQDKAGPQDGTHMYQGRGQGEELEENRGFFLTFSSQQLLKKLPWRLFAEKAPGI